MLANGDIILEVADAITRHALRNVVVDPVLAATAGRRTLLDAEAVSILKSRLLPLASVVTPNAAEASALSGIDVTSLAQAREAAMRIADLGPAAVVVTGGHLDSPDAVDVLFQNGSFTEISGARLAVGDVHGTGCAFSSAIAAGLARGDAVPEAVDRAKRYVSGAMRGAFRIGKGALVLDHFWERLY
jgi:hydroxymethylpyrimidine/phosphomethylpyrimidine kinase